MFAFHPPVPHLLEQHHAAGDSPEMDLVCPHNALKTTYSPRAVEVRSPWPMSQLGNPALTALS